MPHRQAFGTDPARQRALSPTLHAAGPNAPEFLILGTGKTYRRPPRALVEAIESRGIGIEVMDNAAAARTFNVLATEGRRVVAAFLLAR